MRTTSAPGFQRGWRDAVTTVEGLPEAGNRERDVRPVASGPSGAPALYMWLDGAWHPIAASGTGGFQMRFVEGEPSDSLGVNGDLAVDTASPQWDLYQKQEGEYVLIGQFRGAPGEPGEPGGGSGESGQFADREFPALGALVRLGTCEFAGGYEITVSESDTPPGPEDGQFGDVRYYTESGTFRVVRKILTGSWMQIFDTSSEPFPTVLSGPTSPDNGDGADGDLYVHTTTGDLYQKSEGAWDLYGSAANPPATMIYTGTLDVPVAGVVRIEDLVRLDPDGPSQTGIVLGLTGENQFIALFVTPPTTGTPDVLSRDRVLLRRVTDAVYGNYNPVREIAFVDQGSVAIAWLAGVQSQRWGSVMSGEEGFTAGTPEAFEYGTALSGFALIDGEPHGVGGSDSNRDLRIAPLRSSEVTFTLGGPSGVYAAGHCASFSDLRGRLRRLPLTTRRVRVILLGNVTLDENLDLDGILEIPGSDPVEYQPLELRLESAGNQRHIVTLASPYTISGRVTAARVGFMGNHASGGGIIYDMSDPGQTVIGFEDCAFDNSSGGGVLQATGASSQPTFIFRNCALGEGSIFCDMEEGSNRAVILFGSNAAADAIVGPGDRQWDILLDQDSLADLSGSGYDGTVGAAFSPQRAGSDASRPVTPPVGYFRWNSTSEKFEGWNGSAWITFTPDS